MSIVFTRIDPTGADRADLVSFMTRNSFPFHVRAHPTVDQIERAIDDGAYRDDDNDSFWIDHGMHGRIGFLRLEDLSDGAPLFDLRLGTAWRGRGLAADVLRAATDHVFTTMPAVNRFEGQTREDNLAMRRVFARCGWVHEAYYREGWPVDDGTPLASVAYAILRRDWAGGTTTAVAGIPLAADLATAAWQAEERLLSASVRRDAGELARLLADDFIEFGQSGRRWTRAELIDALVTDAEAVPATVLTERSERTLGAGSVLLTYLLAFGDRTSRRSSLWQRHGDVVRCVFHQGTSVPSAR